MIVFTAHAREKMLERGILESEVVQAVHQGSSVGVQERSGNREIRRWVFRAGYEREGRVYPHKEVTVVYVVEGDAVIVLTSIARYGKWETAT